MKKIMFVLSILVIAGCSTTAPVNEFTLADGTVIRSTLAQTVTD